MKYSRISPPFSLGSPRFSVIKLICLIFRYALIPFFKQDEYRFLCRSTQESCYRRKNPHTRVLKAQEEQET